METENTKNGTFFRFEDLRVYHKALDYIDWVYETTNEIEGNGSRILVERFINSSQSIAFYIAEGSARNKSQFVYYLKMAKSAVRECVVVTTIAEKKGLLDEMKVDESRNELMEMTKMLGALIGSLQKSNGRGKNRNNDRSHGNNGNEYHGNDYDDHDFVPSDSVDMNKY
jgi:four helix bundle protein